MTHRTFLRFLVFVAMVVAMSAQGVSAGAQSPAEVPVGWENDEGSDPSDRLPAEPDERNRDRETDPPGPSDDTPKRPPSSDDAEPVPGDDSEVPSDQEPGHEVGLFAPSVTVTPNTDLHHNDVVTVSGSGFSPGAFVGVTQCRDGGASLENCDTWAVAFVEANPSGTWSTPFTVRRIIGIGMQAFDCNTAPGCAIGAANLDSPGYSEAAITPISFVDEPPPPPAIATVDPDTSLTHLQRVRVEGSGFTPNAPVFINQCLADMMDCNWGGAIGMADASGDLVVDDVIVQRVVGTHGAQYVDCLDAPCVLAVQGHTPIEWIELPLEFADVPLPPPATVAVSPATFLKDGQTVDVDGSGYGPGLDVVVLQCTIDSGFFNFNCNFGPTVEVAPDGTFETTIAVSRHLPGGVDCAEVGACVIAAFSYEDVLSIGGTPIDFRTPATGQQPPPIENTGVRASGTLAMTGATPSSLAWVGFMVLALGAALAVSAQQRCERGGRRDAGGEALSPLSGDPG